jgi:2-methylcitrate dehydratase PrpD
MNTEKTVAGALGSFVSSIALRSVPHEVIEKAKACLLSAYGIGLGSDHLPYARVARRAVLEMEGEQANGATIFGDGRKTTIGGATLANATLFHGRNQEDFTWGSTHPSVVIVPVLTALLEAKKLPIDRLVPAVIGGYEVACLLDKAYASKTTPVGFRGTPLYGVVGAAAAVARAYALSGAETAAALANAAAFAGGTLQSQANGTHEWRYQVGVAAWAGLTAAHLAKAGSVSAPLAFEGRAGYVSAFTRAPCEVSELIGKLGEEWHIMNVAFKPYPLPAWNQTPVILGLRVRNAIGNRAIRRVEVRMSPYEVKYPGKDSKGPFATDTAAKLSIAFTVATTLAHGTPTFPLLLDYQNEQTTQMLEKVDVIPDSDVPRLSCIMKVGFENGEVLTDKLTKTAKDYSFNCDEVSKMVRGIGRETDVAEEAYDRLDEFIRKLPANGAIQEVVDSFAFIKKDQ